jgi:3-oxoacyl-[acyl-carrier-protein] synthase-3
MATDAARSALNEAGVHAAELELVIVATSTPSASVPAVASFVANELGATAGTFDINAACAGAVYAMEVAAPVAATGGLVLVIGTDTYSGVLRSDDRYTSILFGDGAGALVIGPGTGRVLGNDSCTLLDTLGHAAIPLGGQLTMLGRDVYRAAVTHVPQSIERVLRTADLKASDLAAVVAHQANGRILTAVAERLGIDIDRIPSTIRFTGNTSAATVPYTLASCADSFRPGDVIAFCGFGGGMTVTTSLWSWGEVVRLPQP